MERPLRAGRRAAPLPTWPPLGPPATGLSPRPAGNGGGGGDSGGGGGGGGGDGVMLLPPKEGSQAFLRQPDARG